MRGGTLPAALIFAGLAFALSFAPRRVRAWGLLLGAVSAVAAVQLSIDLSHAEGVYLACWASVVLAAASVHLPGGVHEKWAVILALACGTTAGAVISLTGGLNDLGVALLAASAILPASWLVGSGREIAVKVVSSWLIAIAFLAAALPLTPTPGYAPDHME